MCKILELLKKDKTIDCENCEKDCPRLEECQAKNGVLESDNRVLEDQCRSLESELQECLGQDQDEEEIIPKPTVTRIKITQGQWAFKCREAGLGVPFGYLDNNYWFCSAEDWAEVLQYIAFHYIYIPDESDCEDSGIQAQEECRKQFGLTAFRLVVGDSPMGRHGWGGFLVGDNYEEAEFWQTETQALDDLDIPELEDLPFVFPIHTHDYFPDRILG